MKLDRSLAVYGLIEHPVFDDYTSWDAIKIDTQQDVRIQQIVGRIINDLGLTDVRCMYAYHDGTVHHDGLRFEYAKMPTAYSWEQTILYRKYYGWGCGLIEATTRRWLSNRWSAFPDDVRTQIPTDLNGWEP